MFRCISAVCRINSGLIFRQSELQCGAFCARHLSVSSAKHGSAGEGLHRTSNFDKKILVWTKMFPTIADVPDEVTEVKMKKAKDVFRIRANIMMALTTVGLCVLYIWSGRRAVERGENIHTVNRDRHFEFSKKSES
ncbi:UPF0389 protein CG9231-like [Babylonia areolata]|uniref:UPF0389 protein CG9231-like n=1 Tax=Babylonia areolata TaxID=304850 RepID=UPI003FCFB2DD